MTTQVSTQPAPAKAAGQAAVSVVILSYNEEANLPDCLASLRGLNCSLYVVDSGSTDRTRDIARAAGAQVVEHPFEHYAAQRNWAQLNLPLDTDWVLHLDADERLTPELVAEINSVLAAPSADIEGFLLRKRTLFMGRWIRHGGHYPSYHLRLFRRTAGRCEDRLYDQHFRVDGRVTKLNNDYLDVLTSDLNVWTARHLRWAELEARQMLAGTSGSAGQDRIAGALSGTPIQQRRWLRDSLYGRAPLFLRPFAYWFYRYFLRLGLLDGREGLIFHFLQGLWFRLVIDAKLWELRRNRTEGHEKIL
jgi:glycosyltransferase involved in cell wall biosynthesis